MSERLHLANMLMDSVSDPSGYVQHRDTVRTAVHSYLEQPDGDPWRGLDLMSRQPYRLQNRLDMNSPACLAAIAMGAVAYEGHMYGKRQVDYAEIWHDTDFALWADLSQLIVSGITPTLESTFTKIDLQAMHKHHETLLQSGAPEVVVLTGLNGVGKTTVLNAVRRYTSECGIEANWQKFPRTTEGPFRDINSGSLSGEIKMNSTAMQYLFVADALDAQEEVTNASLTFTDRHPALDPLVFGPKEAETALLATRGLFTEDRVFWTLVVDRHPVLALGAVHSRDKAPRIYEQKLEQMVDYLVRFAALTKLPGVRWVNTDFPPDENNAVRFACSSVIGTLLHTGVIDRALVNQGVVETGEAGRKLALDVLWTGKGAGLYW